MGMQLTYQPFAQVPRLDDIRATASMNVGPGERSLSALLGMGLIGLGISRSGLSRWLLLGLGSTILKRGITGHCEAYERLHIDRRHPTRVEVANVQETPLKPSADQH
jgi:uncharacterized membrane protein